MAYPSVGARGYDYEAFSEAQGDNSFPGTNVNNDLDVLFNHGAAVDAFFAVSHDSSGALKAGSVTRDALGTDIQMGISPPTPWETATVYAVGAAVTINNSLYVCEADHDSGVFADDLAAGKWAVVAVFDIPDEPPPDSVATASIQDGAVTTAKIADGDVTTVKIEDGAVTRAKLAAAVGARLYGEETDYAGIDLPAGWLWCDGSAVSRTTYADLFGALTTTLSATRTLGSAVLTVGTDMRGKGLIGSVVEGTGIPSGAVISSMTSTTITLDQPASSSGSGTVRISPYGLGNGSTTFNVPDRRGRVSAGRDDMGGIAASRMTSTILDATKLSAAGGAQTHTLTSAEMPTHSHGLTQTPHTHTDSGHTHVTTFETDTGIAGGGNREALMDDSAVNNNATETYTSASGTANLSSESITISVDNAGSGNAHANVQPTSVANKIIFAGV